MTASNEDNSPKESKLDQWIKQNVEPDGAKPSSPKPPVQSQPPVQKTGQTPAPAPSPSPQGQQQSASAPKPEKRGFFNRNRGNRNKSQSFRGGQSQNSGSPQRQGSPAHTAHKPGTQAAHPARSAHHAAPHAPQRQSHQRPAAVHAPRHMGPSPMHTPAAPKSYKGKLRCIPLGGLNEVGKNCMALEYEDDIIIIDMGFQFPDNEFLGVDYIIPDIAYLEDKVHKIRGIIFTHGHLDHIGAVSYIIPKLNFPQMYGTQLTMALIQKQLEEFSLINQSKITVITANDTLQLGAFNISFFGVNHSIPDSVGIVVKTPAGNIVHTGDFKFDLTPSGLQRPAEFDKISALAHQDIAALFIDSTNALKPGNTVTEKKIGESLDSIVKNTDGRIIIASFASQIGRLQQIINIAQKYNRKILLSGRSLIDNFYIASKLGYLRAPQGIAADIRRSKKIPESQTIVLTTGSQGEEVAGLSRMSLEEHAKVKIKKGDTVILSSSPIPGNEKAITAVINNLSRLGANVINNQIMDVHTSGHAQQEDLKLMMTLVQSKAIVPIHGEYFMRVGCKQLATSLGYSDDQGIIIENGDVLEIQNGQAQYKGEKVSNRFILIDGLGVDDISTQVITDRQTLAENGVLVILITADQQTHKLKGEVEVISRGFVYMKESSELVQNIAQRACQAYNSMLNKNPGASRNDLKKYIREMLEKHIADKLDRTPLILPVVIEK